MRSSTERPTKDRGILVFRYLCKTCGRASRVMRHKMYVNYISGSVTDHPPILCENGCGPVTIQVCWTDQPEYMWQSSIAGKFDEYSKIGQALPLVERKGPDGRSVYLVDAPHGAEGDDPRSATDDSDDGARGLLLQ